ncbi:hypothetical protein [Phyllobacterium brassicacearum]|uniref:hypothetical protein n=1 Tax=Phyllobacterium brassicacearum TaxID=314235 RepID=UPI00105DA8C8|nr:hypothetical protein [Phyllobacterium brassicacearum]
MSSAVWRAQAVCSSALWRWPTQWHLSRRCSRVSIGFVGVLVMMSPHPGICAGEGVPGRAANVAAMLGAAAGLIAALCSVERARDI